MKSFFGILTILVFGVALGIAATLVGFTSLRFDALRGFIVPLLLIAAVALLFAFLIYPWTKRQAVQASAAAQNLLQPVVMTAVAAFRRWNGPTDETPDPNTFLRSVGSIAAALWRWGVGLWALAGAIGVLITVLTLSTSFATLLAALRQGDLAATQNEIAMMQAREAESAAKRQNELAATQNEIARMQAQEAVASRVSQRFYPIYTELVSDLSQAADEEQKNGGNGDYERLALEAGLESRLVAVSKSVRPYRWMGDDGKLTERPLSPERGVLLLTIVQFRLSNFSYNRADLRAADLHGEVIRYSDARPANLSMAKLLEADFTDSILEKVDLTEADLRGACFRRAQLEGAKLSLAKVDGADFSHASLAEADLQNVHFESADLTGANLSNADLKGTEFHGAKLDDVDFAGAKFSMTGLEDADMSNSKGLTQGQLEGAFGTSKTKLPRGLKMPEKWVAYERDYRQNLEAQKKLKHAGEQ